MPSKSSTAPLPRWKRSPTPPDPWGEGENTETQDWGFEIIGEEVAYDGTVMHEVRWTDWARADGTKTTWEHCENTNIDSSAYRSSQKRKRKSLSEDTLAVDVPSTTNIHNMPTFLRSQAYEEKLKRSERQAQPNRVAEMAELLARDQEHHGGSAMNSHAASNQARSRRERTRQLTETSMASSSSTPALASRVIPNVGPSAAKPARPTAMNTAPSLVHAAERQAQPNRVAEMAEPLARDQDHYGASAMNSHAASSNQARNRQERTRHLTETTIASSSTTPSLAPKVMPIAGPSTSKPAQPTSMNAAPSPVRTGKSISDALPRKKIKKVPVVKSESSSDELNVVPSTSSFMVHASPVQPKKVDTADAMRRRLQRDWTLAAHRANAAPIYFVNDVDNEAIPPLGKTFKYIENEYKLAPGVVEPDSGFLASCDCDKCGPRPSGCGCQYDWEIDDFAYTPSGLFAFNVPQNKEVIECNKYCACSRERGSCINSVSQRPRDIPIEVFKTVGRGWGVRAPDAVRRGRVLGMYTGLLIRREDSRALLGELGAYCFDLDGDEMVGTGLSQGSQSTSQGKYSVDSRLEGNWTRFINHSCDPNLSIYLVVHDRPADCGMPYIVFVANQDIPARTEFTFDYHPEDALLNLPGTKKGKKKSKPVSKVDMPEGAVECLCKTRICRGFFI